MNNLIKKENQSKQSKKGFNKFNLNKDIILNILKMGYKIPTPIQRKVIPELLSGFNIIAKSRTGSGKSAAFIIPIIEKLKVHSEIVGARCVVLSPTRELAKQTLDFFYKIGKGIHLKYAVMTGGDKIEGQFEKLATNPDIIIATPGRLAHHLEEGSVSLRKVDMIIIDEADKLIEQGFEEQILQIIKSCPSNKQIGLFSATIPERLINFMKLGIRDYKLITLEEESKIPDTLKLHMIGCRSDEKDLALVSIIKECIDVNKESTLIFCPTKYHCEYLSEFLKCYGISSLQIYGNMDQSVRDHNLMRFKKRECLIMLVTDLAARGIDIPMLENVINYNFPDRAKLFIHRIGRTARAGKFGKVISLVNPLDIPFLMDIKLIIGKEIDFNENNTINNKDNCDVISYGNIPSIAIERAKTYLSEYLKSRVDFDEMLKTIKNADKKRENFIEKPSGAGVRKAKEVVKIGISPLYANDLNGDDNLLSQMLKTFKPKKTVFEQLNTESNMEKNVMKDIRQQNIRYLYKKEYEKKKEEYKEKAEEEKDKEENRINIKNDDLEEEYSDESIVEDEIENDVIESKNEEKVGKKEFLGKKKRLQILEKIKKTQFISDKPNPKLSESLWGKEGPLALNELTLNLCPDDLEDKKKSKYVWDDKKKNFVSGNTDKKGNLIRKNEAGVKIKKNEKRVSVYSQWMKKTKLHVQRSGEIENKNMIDKAKQDFKERKQNRSKGSNIVKNEIKSYDQLIKNKKDFSKKKVKFAGQVRAFAEKKIGEQLHRNAKSTMLIKKRSFGGEKRRFNKKR